MTGMPFTTIADVVRHLGRTCSYEDDVADGVCDKCDTPCGSEGSIKLSFYVNPDASALAAYSVAVFGDLRDYGKEDVPKIEAWFKKVTTGKGVMVRNAILEITIEGEDEPVILRHKND